MSAAPVIQLPISQIRLDGGTQPHPTIDSDGPAPEKSADVVEGSR